ncbi:NAD(P)/FAD-dependent oxidoreductase [Tamlana sp. 2_MG-2023]|uniref:NAD(P)/FAD-dependent oxidoreductase n=1 Tax=unclassified Tamlana TaxID=2614803 RepID=UPI0026E24E1A|nr:MULTISPECIES: NAD(P)/FAD-dependent oxidoreductase [unclassified Tamlana]MDO6759717.1 NAD(P)/FAD-dependent oxidoreductase [Tamlana sp. 2_MG-2023]MDO6791340.1 NAD(P)/FAD-dependent oxidoreductase [Tamlana sp. 1_MG-2023]
MNTLKNFEVIIIGGSYSGLSAAMALGRSLRNVLIIDSGLPCNRNTPHSHNFITQDGATPKEISEKAKAQVLKYNTISFLEDKALKGKKIDNSFEITTASGKAFTAKKLIFATGVKDIMPPIKGFSDCWGITVVHCPYCHGYEIKNKKTGIIANGETAFHLATLVKNLTPNLSILTQGKAEFNLEQLAKLKKNNIDIIEKEISEIEHKNGQIKNVIFKDHSKASIEATYASLPFEQHSNIPELLGCELNEQGYIEVDMMQKTSIEGVFACGDNVSRMRSVALAVASGNVAGAVINMELSNEQF